MVLETAGVSGSLLASVKEMKLAYYGHILRKKKDCPEKELIQGTTPGSRTRGRPKMTWIDNIKPWTGLSLTELIRKVDNGERLFMMRPTLVARTAKGRQTGRPDVSYPVFLKRVRVRVSIGVRNKC